MAEAKVLEAAAERDATAHLVVAGMAEDRQPVFSVLVKRSYRIENERPLVRREPAAPFQLTDLYYDHGDPEVCSVRHESDLAPYKLGTDVVVIGRAYAPGGKAVQQMTVGAEVGGRRKIIRVIGDRHCRYRPNAPPDFTDPEPFEAMEIRYERAYGGRDTKSLPEAPAFYPRNHVGVGFVLKNVREAIEGTALPNLEDPEDLLTPERLVLEDAERWNDQPLPQGLGWFQKTWYPRCSFVGAVPGTADPDEVMREERLGLVPKRQIALARQFKLPSFDVRFNNGASLGLVFPFLEPETLLRLARLTPGGNLSFTLPDDWPRIMLDIGLGENELPVVLHTVSIRVDDGEADLIWRGAHAYPGPQWLPNMKRMRAEVR
ncbi:MAG: DUF2169 domain-containing protein [Kiloniellales bacterium]|nr:DUF2169 domain-containing protein [Kiloniellales bacterium]